MHWEVRSGTPARFHHISHGTLGIVLALAAVGEAAGRPDLTGLALAIRELLRFARATAGTDPSYAVPWPDHPAVARDGPASRPARRP